MDGRMFVRFDPVPGQRCTDQYLSSPGVIRRFCSKCGSSLTFEADGLPQFPGPAGGKGGREIG